MSGLILKKNTQMLQFFLIRKFQTGLGMKKQKCTTGIDFTLVKPDLNFENPEVVEEFNKIVFFWLDLGLDGFRCDAVPFLFEEEGTDCQDLPATHQFFKDLRAAIDERYQDKVLLAECAFQYGEELAEYFGSGDEFHMSFHFPIMTGLFYAIKKEHYDVVEKVVKDTPEILITVSIVFS